MKAVQNHGPLLVRITAGMLAGVPSSFIGMTFICAMYALTQRSFLTPFRLIAVSILGEAALLPSMLSISIGMGILMLIVSGIFLGGLFGLITHSCAWKYMSLKGLLFGAGLSWFLRYVYFPLGFNLPLAVRMPESIFAVAICLYGLGLTLLIPIARQLHQKVDAMQGPVNVRVILQK